MVNVVKTKFAGLLQGLLRQLDDAGRVGTVENRWAAFSTDAPVSVAVPPVNGLSAALPVDKAGEVQIALAPVIAVLPMDLRGRLMSAPVPGRMISVPVETVMSQLPFGAVKISFGELRQMAPDLFSATDGEMDNRPVSLSLKEVLARLNPALLARRPAEKVAVAPEISGPFNSRGQGVTFTTQPLKVPVALPPSAPEAMSIPLRQVEPSQPAVFKSPVKTPAVPLSPPPAALSATKISAAPAPAPALVSKPRSEPTSTTVFASLFDLSEHWPEELKNEIQRTALANASVPLPSALIEPGLKRGRVTMSWKQLRTLTLPSSPASPNDNLELDLPLKVIAPLFLASQKTLLKPQPKIALAAEIPDLFFGFPQPAPAASIPPVAPLLKVSESKMADSNFYVWGDTGEMPQALAGEAERPATLPANFVRRQVPPHEVVDRAVKLPGVAGALVALFDGMRVAGKVPVEFNADTLAAFLPQIFERVNQSTRELRMGALNNVSFTVGNVPWKVFRVKSVYFAAFGRAGEALPGIDLAQLAAELDQKNSQ